MITMQKILTRCALLLALVMLPVSAFAITLDEAKAQGLVGEQSDGYLGIVAAGASAEAKALVTDINTKRRAEYQRIAAANNTALSDVEALAGKKTIDKTAPGNYIKVDGGAWRKK